jgi:hypothetical protein
MPSFPDFIPQHRALTPTAFQRATWPVSDSYIGNAGPVTFP